MWEKRHMQMSVHQFWEAEGRWAWWRLDHKVTHPAMQMKPPKSTVLRKQETVQVVETAKVDPTPVVAKVKKEKMLGSWKDGKVLFPPFFSKWFVVLFWFGLVWFCFVCLFVCLFVFFCCFVCVLFCLVWLARLFALFRIWPWEDCSSSGYSETETPVIFHGLEVSLYDQRVGIVGTWDLPWLPQPWVNRGNRRRWRNPRVTVAMRSLPLSWWQGEGWLK